MVVEVSNNKDYWKNLKGVFFRVVLVIFMFFYFETEILALSGVLLGCSGKIGWKIECTYWPFIPTDV